MSSPHSTEFLQEIFKLYRKDGLSCRDIADIMTPQYEKQFGRAMTKNAVIGLLNRHKNMFVGAEQRKIVKINFSNFMEKLEEERQTMKDKDQYKIKKCLSCRKERVLHKVSFLCDGCKSSDKFSSAKEDFSVTGVRV